MTDIEQYQQRITAALDRIGRALEARPPAGDEEGLAEALEAERTANAQLEERVRAIKEKQETTVAALEKTVEDLNAEVASLKDALGDRDGGLQRMMKVNGELRQSNTALREAIAAALPDPHLVNRSMMAELEALRAAQSVNETELAEIAAVLEPILKEEAHG
ncbi:MAG: hypothetical protein QNJ13_05495 [Paracoccaceae bacterium]|nr:hypothetical protein [Paracoccaceae bacterium]